MINSRAFLERKHQLDEIPSTKVVCSGISVLGSLVLYDNTIALGKDIIC